MDILIETKTEAALWIIRLRAFKCLLRICNEIFGIRVRYWFGVYNSKLHACVRAIGHFVVCKEFLQIFEPFSSQWIEVEQKCTVWGSTVLLYCHFHLKKPQQVRLYQALENQFNRIMVFQNSSSWMKWVGGWCKLIHTRKVSIDFSTDLFN